MGNEFKVKNGIIVSGSAEIENDLIVHGTLTATQIDLTVVTSSVLFQSGSTKFGDSTDDVHNMTGSVYITGSITLNGSPIGTGKLDQTEFYTYTTSLDQKTGSFATTGSNTFVGTEIVSGSVNIVGGDLISNGTSYNSQTYIRNKRNGRF